jgi:thioredoxin reductase (NADPH)
MQDFDVVVIGVGAAGMTASMVAARYGLSVAAVGNLGIGGQIMTVPHIETFPGFPQPVGGHELGPLLHEQAEAAGVEFMFDTVEAIEPDGGRHIVRGAETTLRARALIVAAGSRLRPLGLPAESRLMGKGVSTCASCDAPLFKGRPVCVVGGGDSAFDEALVLAGQAARVTIVCREAKPRAQKILVDRALAAGNIDILAATCVEDILGDTAVTGVRLREEASGVSRDHPAEGVFVYIGLVPNTAFLGGLVALDPQGHIETDINMRSSAEGIFAAGDIRKDFCGQLASACGDGATAAVAAARFLGLA